MGGEGGYRETLSDKTRERGERERVTTSEYTTYIQITTYTYIQAILHNTYVHAKDTKPPKHL